VTDARISEVEATPAPSNSVLKWCMTMVIRKNTSYVPTIPCTVQNNNNNVRSSIRNIGCLQIFSSLLGSWR
jgi:hypothetical protein